MKKIIPLLLLLNIIYLPSCGLQNSEQKTLAKTTIIREIPFQIVLNIPTDVLNYSPVVRLYNHNGNYIDILQTTTIPKKISEHIKKGTNTLINGKDYLTYTINLSDLPSLLEESSSIDTYQIKPYHYNNSNISTIAIASQYRNGFTTLGITDLSVQEKDAQGKNRLLPSISNVELQSPSSQLKHLHSITETTTGFTIIRIFGPKDFNK